MFILYCSSSYSFYCYYYYYYCNKNNAVATNNNNDIGERHHHNDKRHCACERFLIDHEFSDRIVSEQSTSILRYVFNETEDI